MGTIRILGDANGRYQTGTTISVDKLLDDFEASCTNESTINWLYRIPIPAAVDYMAKQWGIEYKYI